MSKINDAINWAKNIANDSSHGYALDEDDRWGPDYDCSSFVISAWEAAGVHVTANGASTTSNMCDAFLKTGFTDVTSKVDPDNSATLIAGDVLWMSGHTCMYIGNNQIVNARKDEDGKIGESPEKTEEIRVQSFYKGPWDRVLRYAG